MADSHLDCKGLNCPMPIVQISKAIRAMQSGQSLDVEATDPAFRADVEAWSAKTGHQIEQIADGPPVKATIRKA